MPKRIKEAEDRLNCENIIKKKYDGILFIDNWKKLEGKQEITQLYTELGISQSTMSSWQNGRLPDLRILIGLAERYQISIDELLFPKEESQKKLIDVRDALKELMILSLRYKNYEETPDETIFSLDAKSLTLSNIQIEYDEENEETVVRIKTQHSNKHGKTDSIKEIIDKFSALQLLHEDMSPEDSERAITSIILNNKTNHPLNY